MTNAELAKNAVHRHCSLFNKQDVESWLANFTDIPILEEPVGSPLREGRESLKQLFDTFVSMGVKVTLTPVRIIVNWPEAATQMAIELDTPTGLKQLEAIEIFTVADDGRVGSIRTFVDTDAMAAALTPTE